MSKFSTPIESLESRRLMSASLGGLFNPTVAEDRLVVQADLLKFRYDALAAEVTLFADRTALKGDDVKAATTVTPLIKKLYTDATAMRTTLLEDRLAERANVLKDESVIVLDLRQILIDRGNSTAVAADRVKLKTDRITAQNDMIAGINSRLATRQAAHDELVSDGAAILAAASTDSNASAQLKTDLTTWVNDFDAKLGTMETDLINLGNARTKLSADLTASLA
jgi:hypothetical protein